MRFDLVDRVLERSEDRIVTLKCVSGAEEYLQDHFPTFPVLPGVMMIEAMVQAARRLLAERDPALGRFVLGRVRALKYGAFVRPGDALRVVVGLHSQASDGSFEFKGSAEVLRIGSASGAGGNEPGSEEAPPQTSVSGRFTLRRLRLERASPIPQSPVGSTGGLG